MNKYYDTLGLTSDASEKDVKQAYRKLASKHHPDKGGDEEKFKEVQEAYERITNPDKFKQPGFTNESDFWDHVRRQSQSHHNGQWRTIRRYWDGEKWVTEEDDLNPRQQQQARPVIINFGIDLESTLTEQKRTIEAVDYDIPPTEITIPAGIRNGESIKYFGDRGENDNYNSRPLIVRFRYLPHKKFEVWDANLITKEEVNALDVMLGTEINVKTIDGTTLKIKVPEGSPHGTQLRVPGKGLSHRANPLIRGDMYVIIDVKIPTLTDEEKKIITNMRDKTNG